MKKKTLMMLSLLACCFLFGMGTVDAQQSTIDQRRTKVQTDLTNGTITQQKADQMNARLDQLQTSLNANPNMVIGQTSIKKNKPLTFTPRGTYTSAQGTNAQTKRPRNAEQLEARKEKRAAAAQNAIQKRQAANAALSPEARKANREALKGKAHTKPNRDRTQMMERAKAKQKGVKFKKKSK